MIDKQNSIDSKMSNLKVDRNIVFQYPRRQFKFGQIKLFDLSYQFLPTNSNFFAENIQKIIEMQIIEKLAKLLRSFDDL